MYADKEYRELAGVSNSMLKLFERSPAKFDYYYRRGNNMESGIGMAFGDACHTHLLEPDTFDDRFVVGGSGRSSGQQKNFCKLVVDELIQTYDSEISIEEQARDFLENITDDKLSYMLSASGYAAGTAKSKAKIFPKDIKVLKDVVREFRCAVENDCPQNLTAQEYDQLLYVCSNLLKYPINQFYPTFGLETVEDVLNSDECQKEIALSGVRQGVKIKSKLDMLLAETVILDFKFVAKCDNAEIEYMMTEYGYARQSAFYQQLAGVKDFVFIFAEKVAPYRIKLAKCSKEAIERENKIIDELLIDYKERAETDFWMDNREILVI